MVLRLGKNHEHVLKRGTVTARVHLVELFLREDVIGRQDWGSTSPRIEGKIAFVNTVFLNDSGLITLHTPCFTITKQEASLTLETEEANLKLPILNATGSLSPPGSEIELPPDSFNRLFDLISRFGHNLELYGQVEVAAYEGRSSIKAIVFGEMETQSARLKSLSIGNLLPFKQVGGPTSLPADYMFTL